MRTGGHVVCQAGQRGLGLWSRLGGAAPPESGSHVMLLEAIASLTVSRVGQAALAPHLQLVASVLLRGLDPSNMALRRTCIQVSCYARVLRLWDCALHAECVFRLLPEASAAPVLGIFFTFLYIWLLGHSLCEVVLARE